MNGMGQYPLLNSPLYLNMFQLGNAKLALLMIDELAFSRTPAVEKYFGGSINNRESTTAGG